MSYAVGFHGRRPERRQRMSGVLKHALHRCKDVDTRQLLSNVQEGYEGPEDPEDQFVPSVN